MIMGIIAIDYPEPTGMDWFIDSLKSILPPDPRPGIKRPSHPRPRPDNVPEYLRRVKVSPNPFQGVLRLEINTPTAQSFIVELLDPNGRLVASQTFWKVPAGDNVLSFAPKTRKLKHRIYFLRITDETEHSVTRTVVR